MSLPLNRPTKIRSETKQKSNIMKQKNKLELFQRAKKKETPNNHQQQLHEIDKAVAQALHSHFNNNDAKLATRPEFDPTRRMSFQSSPSRFKLEASKKVEDEDESKIWDFRHSLWDEYEIVAVSKRLEMSLDLECDKRLFKKRKEGKISLWKLFNKMSNRRVSDVGVYGQEKYKREEPSCCNM